MFTSGCGSSSELATWIEPVAGRFAGTGAVTLEETTVLATGILIESVLVEGGVDGAAGVVAGVAGE
jgi:hypothetical protein